MRGPGAAFEAVLRADVRPMAGLTPYARFGHYPVVIGALGLLGTAVWRRRVGQYVWSSSISAR